MNPVTLEEWFSMPEDFLLQEILRKNNGSNKLIGTYKSIGLKSKFGLFTNIRTENFVPLYKPGIIDSSNTNCLEAFIINNKGLVEGRYYSFEAELSPLAIRKEKGKPFSLQVAHVTAAVEYAPKAKVFIDNIKEKFSDSSISITLGNAINTIADEINRLPETFIYELLQNADDYPVKNKVNVIFNVNDHALLFMHDGAAFSYENVDALCNIASGDKVGDNSKTGYKGIGFKSVFAYSNEVFVKSGDFSFQFKKPTDPTPSPWQITPLWVEEKLQREQLNSKFSVSFFNNNVSIAIVPNNQAYLGNGDKSFGTILKKVFTDSDILLFLRNIVEVYIRLKDEKPITIKKEAKEWLVNGDFSVGINQQMQGWLEEQISSGGSKKVPEKFGGLKTTTFSFATRKVEVDGLIRLLAPDKSRLFVYLPTSVDLKFPFLINGDFIPDGSRTELHDLEWNEYLMEQAGRQFLHWMKKIGSWQNFEKSYLKLLPDFVECKKSIDQKHHKYVDAFERGVSEEKNLVAFIPSTDGTLHKPENIVADTIGLRLPLGNSFFKAVTQTEGKQFLHDFLLGEKPLLNLIRSENETAIVGWDFVINLIGLEEFQLWLRIPTNNISFIQWLAQKGKLENFSESPIFLNQAGELQPASALYRTIGDNPEAFSWTDIDYLHPEVAAALEAIEIPLIKTYSAQALLSEKITDPDFAQTLQNKDTNYAFWHYAFANQEVLNTNLLSTLPRFDFQGELIPELGKTYCYEEQLASFLNNGFLPADHVFLIADDYGTKVDTQQWNTFWKSLNAKEAKEYEASRFLQEEIKAHVPMITSWYVSTLAQDAKNINSLKHNSKALWQFIAQNEGVLPADKRPGILKELGGLPILQKGDQFAPLNSCFLSDGYRTDTHIEELIHKFTPQATATLVSNYYATENDVEAKVLGRLWKYCGIKNDTKDLIAEVLKDVDSIDESLRVDAFLLCGKNWSALDAEEQESFRKIPLKLQDGQWKSPSDCVLSEEYTQTKFLFEIFPAIPPPFIVSDEYGTWKSTKLLEIFEEIGVTIVRSLEETLEVKIPLLIDTEVWTWSIDVPEDHEDSIEVVRELITYFHEGKLTSEMLSTLRELPLLAIVNSEPTFTPAHQCFLSSVFKPKLDIQGMDLESEHLPPFLSEVYADLNAKQFLLAVGVMDDFRIEKSDSARLAYDLRSDYLGFVKRKLPTGWVKLMASGAKLSIDSWKRMDFIELTTFPQVASKFWAKFLEDESFQAKFTETVFPKITHGKNTFKTGGIASYPAFFLCNNFSMPSLAGNCSVPSNLYSHKLREIVQDDSLIPQFDFSEILDGSRSFEYWLGIKQELDLRALLGYLDKNQHKPIFKEYGIWEKINAIINKLPLSANDNQILEDFEQSGSLPSQNSKVWKPIRSLFLLDEEIKFSIYRNEWLVNDDAKGLAIRLNVKKLTDSDFTIQYDPLEDTFKDEVRSRLKYLAFYQDSENWKERYESMAEILEACHFIPTRQISVVYGENLIQSTDMTIYTSENRVVYLLRRAGVYDNTLYKHLKKDVFGSEVNKISAVNFKDILIYDEDYVREKCRQHDSERYPAEWDKPVEEEEADKILPLSKDSIEEVEPEEVAPIRNQVSEPAETYFTEAEQRQAKKLMGRPLTANDMNDSNLTALIKGIAHLKTEGYDTSLAEESDNFSGSRNSKLLFPVISNDDKETELSVMCRSAAGGLLYVSYAVWKNLEKEGHILFVSRKDGEAPMIFESQEELSTISNGAWIMKLDETGKQTALNNLFAGKGKLSTKLYMIIPLPGNTKYNDLVSFKTLETESSGSMDEEE